MTSKDRDLATDGKGFSEKPPRLIIGADFVPTESNLPVFNEGDVCSLIGPELDQLINEADYSVFNLETPLADRETPIEKYGPCLIAPTSTIKGLKAVNSCAFTLANNHIMDQSLDGFRSTIATLEEAGLQYFGAGNNLTDAKRPHVVDIAGSTVGIYGCVEHEFSVASENTPGAAPYDPLDSFDDVRTLASECDYTVVLYHGGREQYRYPSPQLRRRCRKFAESGAQLVVCQHSHCIGCEEKWAGSTIVYGQGNFLFDHSDSEFWNTGLLIEVELGDCPKVNYLPLVKTGAFVRLANDGDAEAILKAFFSRSKEIEAKGFVEAAYRECATSQLDYYLSCGIPGSRSLVFRAVNRLCGRHLAGKLIDAEARLALLNHMDCEAHLELFVEGLKARN